MWFGREREPVSDCETSRFCGCYYIYMAISEINSLFLIVFFFTYFLKFKLHCKTFLEDFHEFVYYTKMNLNFVFLTSLGNTNSHQCKRRANAFSHFPNPITLHNFFKTFWQFNISLKLGFLMNRRPSCAADEKSESVKKLQLVPFGRIYINISSELNNITKKLQYQPKDFKIMLKALPKL